MVSIPNYCDYGTIGGFSEEFILKTLMADSTDSIYFKDAVSRFIYVNWAKSQKHMVEDPSEMIGKSDYDYLPVELADETFREEKAIMQTKKPMIGKIERKIEPDGTTTFGSVSKYPLYSAKGEIIGTWGITRDVTEIQTTREMLSHANARHLTMIENISDVIEIANADGILKYVTPNVQHDFGWTADDLLGKSGFDFIHPEDCAGVWRIYQDLLRVPGIVLSHQFRIRCKDGGYKHIEISGRNLIDDPLINGCLLNYHDISERKEIEEEIRFLSFHDSLTNLYNRFFFEVEKKRLDTARQLPLSIIMGDVNGLKLTNDTYGHSEGDKLLVEVACILKKCCRKEDIIARVGGDEFCILLPHTDSAAAQRICTCIYQACDQYRASETERTFYPSISLGHATKSNSDQSVDQVIKNAEDFMYRRKLLERNTTHSSVINSIQATMRESSNDTEEHSNRLIKLSIELGSALGLTGEQLLELDLLSRLHDIGKICIDEKILAKPGKLTETEWAKIKRHPEVGYKIAQASTELIRISQLILNHHERWDGKGYPRGLSGDQIPLLSRIVAIIDAFDAMTQDRPYRKAMTKEEAINEIIENAEKQFDPHIARVFIEEVLHEPWERH